MLARTYIPVLWLRDLTKFTLFETVYVISQVSDLYLFEAIICKCTLQLNLNLQFETVPIFSFVTYNSDRPSSFPSYLKLVLLEPYVTMEADCSRKSFTFDCLLILHDRSRTRTAPFCLHRGDVSGKVWSTLISTQQGGIYPLGFAIQHASSPAPHFALCVYIPCANILALCILSVNIATGCVCFVVYVRILLIFWHPISER